jgi:hypothetical protein
MDIQWYRTNLIILNLSRPFIFKLKYVQDPINN